MKLPLHTDEFYKSDFFYTDLNTIKNLGTIRNARGSMVDIIRSHGWDFGIFHEIYNLKTYYNDNLFKINKGDVVVDLGANIGIFNRWAYLEGAGVVISIEPDKEYYELLKLNVDSKSYLFNNAITDNVGNVRLFHGKFLGGSSILDTRYEDTSYLVESFSLDYLFDLKIFTKIDFLKIDIEGGELLTFNGISDDNLMKINNIALEYHHSLLNYDVNLRINLIDRLSRLGFNSHTLFYEFSNSIQMIYFYK
jgi:FkbM family methyltransferase